VTEHLNLLREAIRSPLPLAYHPLYRFYQGGSLTRAFRGEPERPDDWWSEDWVGSCTRAGNNDPDGCAQGPSSVAIRGVGELSLAEIVAALPEEMVGRRFADRWGAITGVLVKLLSPAGPVPVHAHPSRDWARQHLRSPFGKTEAWIILDAPGDGDEPAYAEIGFVPGVERGWFGEAVRGHDNAAIRAALHRTDVQPGEVYVAHAGVPHCLGPRISFIEIQEPTDHIVIAETSGDDDAGATMGLGWDLALDMIDYTTAAAGPTLERARQLPRVVRTSHASSEARLLHDDVLPYFDASLLDVQDEIEVSDGRFAIAIVVAGSGSIQTNGGVVPIRRGQTFALPASLEFGIRAGGAEPVRLVRCLGPSLD
jgi:mannose-6-phosphate isomerase